MTVMLCNRSCAAFIGFLDQQWCRVIGAEVMAGGPCVMPPGKCSARGCILYRAHRWPALRWCALENIARDSNHDCYYPEERRVALVKKMNFPTGRTVAEEIRAKLDALKPGDVPNLLPATLCAKNEVSDD